MIDLVYKLDDLDFLPRLVPHPSIALLALVRHYLDGIKLTADHVLGLNDQAKYPSSQLFGY
jgi:hypothetical protein